MTTDHTPRGNGTRSTRTPGTHSTATGTAFAWLIAVTAASPACLLAVYLAPQALRAEIAWTSAACALLLSAAVATAAHQRLTVRRLRHLLAEREAATAAMRAAADHFADVTVPQAVLRLRGGASAQTALAAVGPVADDAHRRVLGTLATEVHRGESRRAAAMAACANAAGRVQALTTSMAADLRDMEHRHGDPDVLADLLHLDHRTAQAGRLADSIAVLTGARSGRRWAKPIRMESILRGAMGRIQGYQRVRLHSTSAVAVAGHAAEGVMHALAEIMDNAANFSPPTAEVHVYVEEVSAGVVITVEDGGLVMGEVALRRAQDAVEPRSARDLSALPGTRLGLSVVGRLAHKHGLTVSFRPSAHGGTGVLLRIPQQLVTDPASEPGPAADRRLPRPAARPGGRDTDGSATPQSPAAAKGHDQSVAGGAIPAPRADRPAPDEPEHGSSDPTPVADGGHARTAGEAADAHADRQDASGPGGERSSLTGDGDVHTHTADGGREPAAGAGAEARSRRTAPGAGEHGRAQDAAPGADAVEFGDSGLPRRRRGRTLAAARRAAEQAAERPSRPRSPAESGSRLGAFRRAVRGGGDTVSRDEAPGPVSTTPAADDAPPASPTTSDSRPEEHPE